MSQYPSQPPDQNALMPTRIKRRSQRFPMPDGSMREKLWVQVIEQDVNGAIVTREETIIVPPLSDGTAPEDPLDVLYCVLCQGMVQRSVHAFRCQGNTEAPGCGLSYCTRCRVRVQTESGVVQLCTRCAGEARRRPVLKAIGKLIRSFWDVG